MNDSQRDRYEAAKSLVNIALTTLPHGEERERELIKAIGMLEYIVEDIIATTPAPEPDTVPVYPSCAHCHVRHDPRMACRVLPDGAVLITTNYAS